MSAMAIQNVSDVFGFLPTSTSIHGIYALDRTHIGSITSRAQHTPPRGEHARARAQHLAIQTHAILPNRISGPFHARTRGTKRTVGENATERNAARTFGFSERPIGTSTMLSPRTGQRAARPHRARHARCRRKALSVSASMHRVHFPSRRGTKQCCEERRRRRPLRRRSPSFF